MRFRQADVMEASSRPPEQFAKVGEIELCYDELGDPDGEPMLMVMGLGTQLIHWHPAFCAELGEHGFRVIRFDNRDAGRSSRVKGPPPKTISMLLGIPRGLAYTLGDMADDAIGLLGALGIESAHLTGISMGGMIAQVAGYRHPDRVRSLALISTGSGKRTTSLPRLRALGTLLAKPPRSREQFTDLMTDTFEVIGSPAYPMDERREAEFRAMLEETWRRGHNPAGTARQLHAITASGDRSGKLRGVRAPTIVIHGDSDPLVRPSAGRSLADAIPGAELKMIDGLGHDMPPELFGEIADAIAANALREGAPAGLQREGAGPRSADAQRAPAA
jgi:pimeloyl-ACP methyl ester carboxylesterase